MTMAVMPGAPRRARMWAYAWWQCRDFAMSRALVIVAVGILSGWPLVRMIRAIPDANAAGTTMALSAWMHTMVLLFVFFAVNGMVARDRTTGTYRFLFAKPVSVPRFYAQVAAVNLLGLLASAGVMYLVALAFGATLPPRFFFAPFVVVGVGMGGLYFLVSVLTKHDVSVTGVLGLVSSLLYGMFGDETGIRGILVHALPPAHRLLAFGGVFGTGSAYGYTLHDALWIMGYGVGAFLVGVLLLSRRPLGVT